MLLYVPSLGRTQPHEIDRGPLVRIPKSYQSRTYVVVDHGEYDAYRDALARHGLHWVQVLEMEPGIRGIGPKRHWIGRHAESQGEAKFVMMDDDIDFLIRRGPDDWRLTGQTTEDTERMFINIESYLDQYASVGISSREGNNRAGVGGIADLVVAHTRVMRMFGVRTRDWLEMEHGRVEVMEDFDLQLQLLRAGRGNACLFYFANGQKMTNAPGGCFSIRTHEVQDRSAKRLAELHPGLVRLRQKTNKTDAEGMGTRTEVTVMWKKAAGK